MKTSRCERCGCIGVGNFEICRDCLKKAENKMTVFVVSALRWGDNENHSYNVGVYSKLGGAMDAADGHSIYRGGKYECIVEEIEMDRGHLVEDGVREVYRTA